MLSLQNIYKGHADYCRQLVPVTLKKHVDAF